MLDIRGYRKRAKGLPDLIPYLYLTAEGVVANKDCSLTAAWEYRGSDTASSTQDELDFVSGQVNQALMTLGNGWMVQVDAVRRPSTSYPESSASHFPDPVSRMIDEERRAFFSRATCYETNTILSLTYKPSFSLAMDMMTSRKAGDKVLAEFQDHLNAFESTLSGVLDMERLGEYELPDTCGTPRLYSSLLSHLQFCLTGDFRPVMVPRPVAMYLDGILGNQDLVGGEEPKIGDKRLFPISIDGSRRPQSHFHGHAASQKPAGPFSHSLYLSASIAQPPLEGGAGSVLRERANGPASGFPDGQPGAVEFPGL